jgi:hypothetical protein
VVGDSNVELLGERVERMEADAFSFIGGLGASSYLHLNDKMAQLQLEYGRDKSVQTTLEPDFVSSEINLSCLRTHISSDSGNQR